MAVSVKECQDMIAACKKANRMLSIGYRLHFDPFNLMAAQLGKNQTYGKVRTVEAIGCQEMEAGKWRLNRQLSGGGPEMGLRDVRILMAIYEAAPTGKRIPLNL